jgi:ribonucleoside-diphosphate reductase alpha chain
MEQPLPPYGACLLGSFNLVKYVTHTPDSEAQFDWALFTADIAPVVRAMDNVIDRTQYPLPEQEKEAKAKRRMGLGFTGLANALTLMDMKYGSAASIDFTKKVGSVLSKNAYAASAALGLEKGNFPDFECGDYLKSGYVKRLPLWVREKIGAEGMRNSHLTSIAPTGTISFTADNVSSGIEPVFAHEVDRSVITENGTQIIKLKDYVWNYFGIKAETTEDLSTDDHLAIQVAIQPYIDSAVSKTINVGDHTTFAEFKDIYMKGWKGKLKGVTTFRLSGKRYGVLNKSEPEDGAACFIDADTGVKTCDE